MRSRNATIPAVMLIMVLLLGCGMLETPAGQPCRPTEGARYLQEVQPIVTEFSDAVDVAVSTPRVALASVIAEMQMIRREAESMEVVPCARKAHTLLLDAMEASIDGTLSFLADDDDAVTVELLERGADTLDAYLDEVTSWQE